MGLSAPGKSTRPSRCRMSSGPTLALEQASRRQFGDGDRALALDLVASGAWWQKAADAVGCCKATVGQCVHATAA